MLHAWVDVVVEADSREEAAIAALELAKGRLAWEIEDYSSPEDVSAEDLEECDDNPPCVEEAKAVK